MISVSGGRACRDRDGVGRLAGRPVRVVSAAMALAAQPGRSMVCLRRGGSAASASSPAGSRVNSDDIFDVRLVLVDSVAVDGVRLVASTCRNTNARYRSAIRRPT